MKYDYKKYEPKQHKHNHGLQKTLSLGCLFNLPVKGSLKE
jgi:hypothetical protein